MLFFHLSNADRFATIHRIYLLLDTARYFVGELIHLIEKGLYLWDKGRQHFHNLFDAGCLLLSRLATQLLQLALLS